MAQHTVLNLGLAAATDAAGTPFAAFGLNSTLYFHKGVDPSAPAASADGSVTGQTGSGLENPALARDKAGAIWLAWFQLFGSREGYYVARVLPSKAAPVKAPGSGSGTSADNEPRQQVALAARPGGGVYLAYCTATATKQCAHIDLWKVGSAHPMVVPGSGTGSAGRVALAVGPGGRLTVAWFDFGQNKIHVVRTRVREELAGQPRPGVSFLGSLLMPEDEVLLCLFCGPEADVRAVSERAGLPFERIIGCLRLGCDIRQDRAVITLTSKSTITMKCDDFGSGANAHAVVLTAIG